MYVNLHMPPMLNLYALYKCMLEQRFTEYMKKNEDRYGLAQTLPSLLGIHSRIPCNVPHISHITFSRTGCRQHFVAFANTLPPPPLSSFSHSLPRVRSAPYIRLLTSLPLSRFPSIYYNFGNLTQTHDIFICMYALGLRELTYSYYHTSQTLFHFGSSGQVDAALFVSATETQPSLFSSCAL